MKTLLHLQELDLKVEVCVALELEIPKQKHKFDIHRERLQAELVEREDLCRRHLLEQGDCEGEIEQKQEQIGKYEQQLNAVKKNDEYQALIHEIDLLKKQIGLKEERIITIMVELDDAKARLEEARERIRSEIDDIDRQCADIDAELSEAVEHRRELEAQRVPLVQEVDRDLVHQYQRIRASKKTGPAVVPLNDEVCGGCHMHLRAQVVNEVLAGNKTHTCGHCGRLLYYRGNVADPDTDAQEDQSTSLF